MAARYVSMNYQFVFSKDANIWNHAYEFEKDIADFFAANGLECEAVNLVEGSHGGRLLLISKIQEGSVGVLTNVKGVNLQKEQKVNLAQPLKSISKLRKSSSIVNRLTDNFMRGNKKVMRRRK